MDGVSRHVGIDGAAFGDAVVFDEGERTVARCVFARRVTEVVLARIFMNDKILGPKCSF